MKTIISSKSLKIFIIISMMTSVLFLPLTNTGQEVHALSDGIKTSISKHWSDHEWEVLKLTNKERRKSGLQPLSFTKELQQATDVRANEITREFSHLRPGGTDCFTVLSDFGISCINAGENIAAGQRSPKSVMSSWLTSPGHRYNILGSKFNHIGIGYKKISNGYGSYWVQLFTGGFGYGNDDITKLEVGTVSSNLICYTNNSIDSYNLILIAECSHGTSYMPLTSNMCTGFNNKTTSVQQISVSYAGLKTSFSLALKPEPVVTKSIQTAQKTIYLKKGQSVNLPVAHYTKDGRKDKITYKSSKPKIVSVSTMGKIKAKKNGTSKITVKAPNGKQITITVKVDKKTKKNRALKVTVSKKIKVGQSVFIKTKTTKGATKAVPIFKSSNKNIFTVDKAGRITALKKGKAKLTVKAGKKKKVVTITVS